MEPFDAHHLGIRPEHLEGNGGRGRVIFVPGSLARTQQIAEHFDGLEVHTNPRRLDVHLGRLRSNGQTVDVAAVPTGMGCASLGIVLTELIELGGRRFLRVGSAGTLQPQVSVGDLVVATAAVRDEGASDAYVPAEVPAVAHSDWIVALASASQKLGELDHTYLGLVHTKDSLYGREFPMGPRADENRRYMELLQRIGVLASEMESSHLFLLSTSRGPDVSPLSVGRGAADVIKAGTILAVIGDQHAWAPSDLAQETEARAVRVAVQAALDLVASEDGRAGVIS
ncbi:MAG: nucleoside phosphorylase [Proteobacteria bacterium]|nr:nucleoside phosphorylase [Pseudomonadota bacterium]